MDDKPLERVPKATREKKFASHVRVVENPPYSYVKTKGLARRQQEQRNIHPSEVRFVSNRLRLY